MPKYTFICQECSTSTQSIEKISTKTIDCTCGREMLRQLPKLGGQEVKETIDKLTGRGRSIDHDELLLDRNTDHFWAVEVPRLVQSGIYGEDTMLENGWVYYDDNGKMHIHKKPLHRR